MRAWGWEELVGCSAAQNEKIVKIDSKSGGRKTPDSEKCLEMQKSITPCSSLSLDSYNPGTSNFKVVSFL